MVGRVDVSESRMQVEYRRRRDTGEVVPTVRGACPHGCYVLPTVPGHRLHVDESVMQRWRYVADIDSILSAPLTAAELLAARGSRGAWLPTTLPRWHVQPADRQVSNRQDLVDA